jgi:hypothetical protein
MSPDLKYDLADELMSSAVAHLDAAFPECKIEVQRVTTLQMQIKVWENQGAPRYFTLQLREQM